MYIKESYELDPSGAVSALEDLAESCIESRYLEGYTLKGIVSGKSREAERKLLPKRYRHVLSFLAGSNAPVLNEVLKGAKEISKGRSFTYSGRFNVADLLGNKLQREETITLALVNYGILGRDDYTWYLWLTYQNPKLTSAMGDNTQWTGPDIKFRQLYERLFGNVFQTYSK